MSEVTARAWLGDYQCGGCLTMFAATFTDAEPEVACPICHVPMDSKGHFNSRAIPNGRCGRCSKPIDAHVNGCPP